MSPHLSAHTEVLTYVQLEGATSLGKVPTYLTLRRRLELAARGLAS